MPVVVEEDDAGTKKETKKATEKLKKDLDDGTEIAKELDKVWKAIKDDAYNACPKETGALARTIRVVKIPMGVSVGGLSRIKELTIFDRSIVAGDITKTNPKTGKPIDYASWVHDGHRMKDGRMFAGVPFLTMAMAKHDVDLNKAIEKALKKLAKKHGWS